MCNKEVNLLVIRISVIYGSFKGCIKGPRIGSDNTRSKSGKIKMFPCL
jgi:hypothetical protein